MSKGAHPKKRTSLLLNVSLQEAAAIHEHATAHGRPISNYVLHIIMHAVEFEEDLFSKLKKLREIPLEARRTLLKPRTTVHVRCSVEERRRIRLAARRSVRPAAVRAELESMALSQPRERR